MLEKKAMVAFSRNLKFCEINNSSFKANGEENVELKIAHQSLKCAVLCIQDQVRGKDISRCTECSGYNNLQYHYVLRFKNEFIFC